MGYQPLEDLLPKAKYSIYKLIRMASRRALELADGQGKLIDIDPSTKTATIALEEIRAGKVVLKEGAKDIPPQKAKEAKKEEKTENEKQESLA